jgi:outer membrane protein TolC
MPHTHDDTPERASGQAQGFLAQCAASAGAGLAVALLCLGSADAGAQTLRAPQAPAAAPLTSAVQAVAAQPPSAQPRVLTLDDALALAEKTSEQVTMAEAGVTRAESAERRVRSEWYPQVSALASYDRALASEFEGLFDAGGTPCTPLP